MGGTTLGMTSQDPVLFRNELGSLGTKITTAGWWCNNQLEKYEFVNGVGIIPYIYIYIILWKIKAMFETTNQ